ncbi:MAG: hypothetical protein PHO27_10490 [Sulfuricurvum sp.]|nr:hypothetical protein [Sulfuricurvum sp.]
MVFNSVKALITSNQMGMLDFKVDLNLTFADMRGSNDLAAKLLVVTKNVRNAYKALFISLPNGKLWLSQLKYNLKS